MKTYIDIGYTFLINVSQSNSGSVSVYESINSLYEGTNGKYTRLTFKNDNEFCGECQINKGIIIVTDGALLCKKIDEKINDLHFRNNLLNQIIEERGSTTITKLYNYQAEIDRLTKVLEKTKIVLEKFNQNIKVKYSFFNNSSIWIRLVIKDGNDDEKKIEEAIKDLKYFEKIGLYNYDSAKENLEYNIRIQKQNYLDSTTLGHGVYVTPQLYGDETEHWKFLFKDNKCVQ